MSFPATRLSVVERTRSGDEETRRVASAAIIEADWKPVDKYLRMKWSLGPDEAADHSRNPGWPHRGICHDEISGPAPARA